MTSERLDSVFAFDPGAVRTGMAVREVDMDLYCRSFDPWDAVTYLESQPPISVGLVILEKWVSYPHRSSANAWRDLLEVRTIGALERHCMRNQIPYIFQSTRILKGTMAAADAAGYEWRSDNRDEKAAETHLYYYLNIKEKTQ